MYIFENSLFPSNFDTFYTISFFVKLQSQVQTSVLGLGVDFVLPLSQQEQQPPPKIYQKSEIVPLGLRPKLKL